MAFDVDQSRQTWDEMIREYGHVALLRQPNVVDRYVICMRAQFTALERMGGISNPSDRKMLLSVFDPDGELLDPDPSEREVLVIPVLDSDGVPVDPIQTKELLKMVAPPAPVGPGILYWRLQVRA
jgi:hypothetical protein